MVAVEHSTKRRSKRLRTSGGRDCWAVDVEARVLLLPFRTAVLEPDLDLRLGEVE